MNELWQALTVLALVLGIGSLLSLLFFALRLRALWQQQQQSMETLQKDLRALCQSAVQVGGRVSRLEQGLKQLQQRQQELGMRQDKMIQPEPEARNFEQAIKLAQKGASIEELMDICDLSRGEAELMSMMHRLSR